MYTLARQTDASSKAAHELIDARLRVGSTACFTITTTSMWPTLAPGDRLTVSGEHTQPLRTGDIILLNHDQIWLAHRLIGFQSVNGTRFLITKGDNVVNADPAWSLEQWGGRVTAMERGGSQVSMLSRRARGAGVVIAFLSRQQWHIQQATRGRARHLAVRAMRLVLFMTARVARAAIS